MKNANRHGYRSFTAEEYAALNTRVTNTYVLGFRNSIFTKFLVRETLPSTVHASMKDLLQVKRVAKCSEPSKFDVTGTHSCCTFRHPGNASPTSAIVHLLPLGG
jgi:hypothetical protein